MTRSEEKLGEAHFFLEKLIASISSPDADHYLNAFISSARSVTWVMKSEYGRVPGWQEWYSTRTPSNEESDILKKVNDLRVRSTKRSSIKMNYMVSMEIPADLFTSELEKILTNPKLNRLELKAWVVESRDGMTTKVDGNQFSTVFVNPQTFRGVEELPGEDIINTCKIYYTILKGLISDCGRKFNP